MLEKGPQIAREDLDADAKAAREQIEHNMESIVAVAASASHSVLVTSGARVLSWGANPSGCLGHSFSEPRSALPRPILLPRRHVVIGVAAGSSHTLMLTDQGKGRPVI